MGLFFWLSIIVLLAMLTVSISAIKTKEYDVLKGAVAIAIIPFLIITTKIGKLTEANQVYYRGIQAYSEYLQGSIKNYDIRYYIDKEDALESFWNDEREFKIYQYEQKGQTIDSLKILLDKYSSISIDSLCKKIPYKQWDKNIILNKDELLSYKDFKDNCENFYRWFNEEKHYSALLIACKDLSQKYDYYYQLINSTKDKILQEKYPREWEKVQKQRDETEIHLQNLAEYSRTINNIKNNYKETSTISYTPYGTVISTSYTKK